MGLMRRLAAAALAAVLLLSTALGERVTFRLSADIDPVQYPAQERKLAQGLKALFRLLTVEGDVFAVEHRELKKRGAWVICFDMTDYTSSVRVNQFMEASKAKPIIDLSLIHISEPTRPY